MNAALERLLEVQHAISDRNDSRWPVEFCEKLLFCRLADAIHIEFYGSPFDEEFGGAICSPEVAPHVGALEFRGPDVGANGTRNWDLSLLLESETMFPKLRSVLFETTAPEHHNQTIIACVYEEDGQIGRLLAKSPALESLVVPSAPNRLFFEVRERPLRFLRVDAGYDTQNFILNLSQSTCFPHLRTLDFGDYNQRGMDDYAGACTPFEHYRSLFRSAAFSGVGRFVLRNSALSSEQLLELHQIRRECQFMVIDAPMGRCVRDAN